MSTYTTTKVKSRDGIDAESLKRDLLVLLLQYDDPDVVVDMVNEVVVEILKEIGAIDYWDTIREKLGCELPDSGYDCDEDDLLEMDSEDDDWLSEEEF